MVVLSGSNFRPMAEELAKELGCEHYSIETEDFLTQKATFEFDEVIDAIRRERSYWFSIPFPIPELLKPF